MKITFQYTILDFRALSKLNEVMKPAWFKRGRYKIVESDKRVNMLKYTGVIYKHKHAIDKPKTTNDNLKHTVDKPKTAKYYTAHKAIRFPSCSEIENGYGYEDNGQIIVPQVMSRTFKPKNQLVNTYKINFVDSFFLPINKSNVSLLEKIIDHYRKIPVTVPHKFEKDSTILQDIGISLSHQFYVATTAEPHAKSILRFLLKSDKEKYKIYEKLVAKKMMHCRPVAIFEFYGAADLGKLYNENYKICDFVDEGISVYRRIIHDRMNIWLITKPQDKLNKDLINKIKLYILEAERESHTIQKLVEYIRKNPHSKYRKVTLDQIRNFIPLGNKNTHKGECNTIQYRVLRANIDRLITDCYFNKNHQFDKQQEQIRTHIMGSVEGEAKDIMATFPDFESLRLKWNTIFVLIKKDFWKVAASELMQSHPESDVILREFIQALECHDFKKCIKLLNPYRDLIEKLLLKAFKTVTG